MSLQRHIYCCHLETDLTISVTVILLGNPQHLAAIEPLSATLQTQADSRLERASVVEDDANVTTPQTQFVKIWHAVLPE